MTVMKAVQVSGDRLTPRIIVSHTAIKPEPTGSQILVQVHAAGITGPELTWPELFATPNRTPGHDISGIIRGFGPNYCGSLAIGQPVYAMLDAATGQGQADFIVCSANEVALKPTSISHVEASALPIPLLTAWEAIFDHHSKPLQPHARILVTGASGAVGLMFIQLARHFLQAHIVALASAQHHSKLRQLGAEETLDYNVQEWEKTTANVDMVFDTAGGEVLEKSWSTIHTEGLVMTVADPPPAWAFGERDECEPPSRLEAKRVYFIVSPNSERLARASELIDSGALQVLAIKKFPLHEAAQAWSYAQQRNRAGQKVVLDLAE